ncbi:class I tRNA ligase family protein, partial [bacterium]|nr:class I tRNA ligase family protein [bacterium]
MERFNFPQEEEKILRFWQKKKIYQKSLANRKKEFSFYDGPPFATGKPHYGHILASSIKDTICRFYAQRNFRVERRVGWDCHGLPVETLVEKELGVSSKKEIEKLGIEKFNSACRKAVTRHVDDFEKILTRLGRWADYEGAYFTMDNSYIETVWWVLKQIAQLGLLYEDFRVNAYCPRCGTPLSNFEVNQGYQIVRDTSIYVLFKVKGEKNTYFLVWTTTPWTLPGNLMLAVGDFRYVKVKVGERYFILAEERLPVLKERFSKVESCSAKDLEGKEYEPLYPEASKDYPSSLKKKAFKVYLADFVTLE